MNAHKSDIFIYLVCLWRRDFSRLKLVVRVKEYDLNTSMSSQSIHSAWTTGQWRSTFLHNIMVVAGFDADHRWTPWKTKTSRRRSIFESISQRGRVYDVLFEGWYRFTLRLPVKLDNATALGRIFGAEQSGVIRQLRIFHERRAAFIRTPLAEMSRYTTLIDSISAAVRIFNM
jgi:hypothetical protein